ncbi:MAG: MCE family protein [Gammaproteobacteria bacterium]|nr:MCE family protein [Gammaproteobacteria bacterium]
MENRAHAIATGVFVVVFVTLLVASAIWLDGTRLRGAPYDLITEASVAGLSVGAPVRLRGVEVGAVQRIGFDPSDQRRIRVRALLDPSVRLPEGTHATISYQGLSGTAYVELDYPDEASGTLHTSAAAPARIPMQASGLAHLADAAEGLIKTFTGTLQRVDGVLTPETSRKLSELVVRLNDSVAAVTVLTRDLQPAARHVDSVIANANGLIQSLGATARDADTLIVTASSRDGALDAVRDSALNVSQSAHNFERAVVHQTLPRIDVLADRLARASDTLDQLLQQVQNEPQSLVFGPPPPTPGPGEPGFR